VSSSAKADDPVPNVVSILTLADDYWIPAFAGMTAAPAAIIRPGQTPASARF
jgi:hypothetical protein